MYTFGIIGGGAAGVATMLRLVRSLAEKHLSAQIVIFEKNATDLGAGLAYSTEDAEHILNLPTTSMSALPENPNHFCQWIKDHEQELTELFPQVDFKTDLYPPRKVFAKYLQYVKEHIIRKEAMVAGIIIEEVIRDEVINIIPHETNKNNLPSVEIHTKNTQEPISVNQVFVATGHIPATTYSEHIGIPGYFHSPWLTKKELNIIPKEERIVILGSGLTALDAALSLRANGHTGEILMVSRHGLIPAVLGPVEKYDKKYLTSEEIDRLTDNGTQKLSLAEVMELFWKEIEYAENRKFSPEQREKLLNPRSNPAEWLEKQMSGAQEVRPWQQVLFSLYPIVPKLWDALDFKDQEKFLKLYYSNFMARLAATPRSNGIKLRNMVEEKRLEVKGDLKEVKYNKEEQIFQLAFNEKTQFLDTAYLINATGAGRDYTLSPSPLFKNLFEQKLVTPHPLGGLQVFFQTLNPINQAGELVKWIYCMGGPTWGNCMATDDFNQVQAEIRRCVNTAIKCIDPEYNPTLSSRPWTLHSPRKEEPSVEKEVTQKDIQPLPASYWGFISLVKAVGSVFTAPFSLFSGLFTSNYQAEPQPVIEKEADILESQPSPPPADKPVTSEKGKEERHFPVYFSAPISIESPQPFNKAATKERGVSSCPARFYTPLDQASSSSSTSLSAKRSLSFT